MMRRGVRDRLRRLIALGTGTLLAAGALSAVTTVTTAVPATAAPAPFSCDAFGYLFQTPESGVGTEVDQVNLADGTPNTVANLPVHMNAVAYNELDNLFYAYSPDLGKVVKIGSDWSVTPVANPPVADVGYDMADIDPDTGHYWIGKPGDPTDPGQWAEMDMNPASPGYGSTIASGTMTLPAGLRGGVDWSFIGNRLYRVMQEDTPGASEAHLVRFNPNTHDNNDLGALGFTVATKVGATFVDKANDLFSSDNGDGAIWRIKVAPWLTNPAANPPFHVSNGPQSGNNDGARCANAPIPTLTVTKQVGGRVDPSDQFGVALRNSGGSMLTFATTVGTTTRVSTTDVPVTQGASFTISDYMLAGSASPISYYTPTISCVDTNGGAAPPVSGSAPVWTVTVENATYYACTVTNTPNSADLAISKTGPATIDANGTITWTLSVTNNGPATSPSATVTDDIPAGVTNVAAPGCTVAAGTVTCPVGSLANGASQQLAITGTAPSDYSTCIVNTATVTGLLPEPPNSTGPNSAQWRTCTNGPNLQVTKTAQTEDGTTNAPPGSVVKYTLTVNNPGPGAYTAAHPATITDDLSGVLDDATLVPGSLSASGGSSGGASGGTPSISGTTLSWSGVPGINSPVTITYSVTVNTPDTGDHDLANAVNSINGQGCPPAACPPSTHSYVPELTVTKTADTTDAAPGSVVTYTVNLHNGGTGDWTDAYPASFTDDLSGVLDDASYNKDASHGAGVSGTTLSWSGALAHGADLQITYSVTVNLPDTGDHKIVNAITSVNGYACPPANCPPATTTLVPDLTVTKTADTTNATPGSTVVYTITLHNGGTGDWTDAYPASFTDDLSGVLDDASYNKDATHGAAVSGTTLSWSGPLAHGADLQITYSVTVNLPDTGDHKIVNAITSVNGYACPPANCPAPTTTRVPDLTVTKTADTTNAAPGTKVTYSVVLKNTGTGPWTAGAPASFTDDLTGVLDDATYNKDATHGAAVSGTTLSWSGALDTGATLVITYSVSVKNPDTGDHNLRNAISSVNGRSCPPANCPPPTTTLTPGLRVVKTASRTDAAPGSKINYTITVTNTGKGDWTADSPAALTDDMTSVLDDASYNNDASVDGTAVKASYTAPKLTWSGPLAAGASFTITYSVTVHNPDTGDHNVDNAVATNAGNCLAGSTDQSCVAAPKVPDLQILKRASTGDAAPGSTITYTITVTNSGTGAWAADQPASLSDDLSGVLDDASFGTIATGKTKQGATVPDATVTGSKLAWAGPLAAGDYFTITYSVKVKNPSTGDYVIANTVVAPTGNCASGSRDAACSTTTLVPDMAVSKTVSSTNAAPGTALRYTIVVSNPGAGAWTAGTPASLTDDLSSVLDDATYNNDAVASATAGGGSVPAPSYTAPSLTWSGPLAAGDSFTITYSVTLDNPDTGDHRLNNAVVAPYGPCLDPTNPACATPTTTVPDMTVTKAVSSTNATPGSTLTYTITVANPGTGDWTATTPASLSDDLSGVLDDAAYNADAVASATAGGGSVPAPSYTAPSLTWSGPLAAGDSFTITYSVTLDNPDGGDHLLNNAVVTPYGPCVDPANPACAAPTTTIPDLAVSKTVSSTDAAPGSTITYTITVANPGTGDWTDAAPAAVSDNLSKVLDDATFNDDAVASTTADGASVPAPSYTAPTLSWSGPLAAGDSFTIVYSVTLRNPNTGDYVMANSVVAPTGNCMSGSSDAACATQTLVPDMAVTKAVSSTNAAPGTVVTYTIVVSNPGAGAWTAGMPASLSDDLSSVLDDATYNNDAVASATAQGASVPAPAFGAPALTWSGPLAAGDSFTITYSVTLDNPDSGDHLLNNGVVTPYGPCVDPANPDCQAPTTTIPDMAVSKAVSSTNAAPGSTLTYTITVANPGTGDWTDATPASLSDDLSQVLDDAVYNDDAAASTTANGASVPAPSYTAPSLAWSGPLAAGDSFTITYSVTLDNPDVGDHLLNNGVVTPYGPCVDPAHPDCQAPTTTIPDMAVSKAVSSTNAAPGSTLTYTITVANPGTGDWTDATPASLSDDLSQVLDDAVYNDDAAASATANGASVPAPSYTAPSLAWSGPLAAGDSFTITYSVTLDNPDVGDHLLNNGVVTPYGPCVDPAHPDCQAPTTTIPDLAVTKVSSTDDAAPGTTVDYTITVTNPGTGDWTDDMPASFTDDLTQVLDDATYNDDLAATTGAMAPAPTYTEPEIAWSGPLVAGASFTVTYSVTINNPDTGDHAMVNTVVDPAGNCLDGSTDQTCGSTTLIPELNVVKKASATTVGLRKTLSYTLTITNPGKGDWTDTLPATVTDDLSDVLDDATYNSDAKASAGTVELTKTTLTWTGPLPADGTVTVTYSVTVNDHDTGNHQLDNHVSTPTGNCDPEPTNPDCNTTTPVAAYVLTKTSDPKSGTTVHAGQRINYTVTVVNTGKVDLTPTVRDDLSKVLTDAAYHDDAKASAGTVKRAGKHLVWTVPLPIGATATLTYTVTVSSDGDYDLVNVAAGDGPVASCGGGQSVCTTDNPTEAASALALTGAPAVPGELLGGVLLLLLGGLALLGARTRRAR